MARPKSDIEPRIVEAARAQFLEQGVDGSSLRTIASAAGTSVGMIHYYYPSKDDLFLAVVEKPYVGLLADLQRALSPDAPVEERLRRLFHRLAALSADEISMVRLVAREVLISSARFGRLFARFERGHIPLFLRLLQDGLSERAFDERRSPAAIVVAILALAGPAQFIRRVAGERGLLPGPADGATAAGELLDVLLHGIAAPPSSKRDGGRR